MIIDAIALALVSGVVYAMNVARGLYPGDAGDLVAAAATGGVPHPPGYPLYTALGWLVTRLPVATPAWRMAWLSLLPHVATLGVVYLITYRFTKSRLASLFAALLLAGNYLFFLYSVTPEVFAFLDLFVALLFFLSLGAHDRKDGRAWLPFFAVLGLSFAHHPLILFLLPSLAILLYPKITAYPWSVRRAIWSSSAFLAGLLPYLYIPFAARGYSPINWDRATTLARFIQLITRQDYGAFVSGSVVGHSMLERVLNVKAYAVFVALDFTWVGVILAVIGILAVWKQNRRTAVAWVTGWALLGPGFYFYASFPTVNRFVLGTVERFLLPSYVLLAPLCGIGAVALTRFFTARVLSGLFSGEAKRRQVATLLLGILFVVPVTVTAMNLWRFDGLSRDATAENFIRDLLDSAPPNSIVLLSRDTPIFGAQYLRYATGYRPDIAVLHAARMPTRDYHEIVKIVFPDLFLPSEKLEGVAYLSEFMTVNQATRPVLANVPLPAGKNWIWVPYGLLYRLTPAGSEPPAAEVIAANDALWASYHNPQSGLLSRYNHLFLTSPLDDYAIAAISYGKYLLTRERFDQSVSYFQRAVSYGSDTQTPTAWMFMGLSYSLRKQCSQALDAYAKAKRPDIAPDPSLLFYEGVTWRDCVGNAQKAEEYFAQYKALDRRTQLPLEGAQ